MMTRLKATKRRSVSSKIVGSFSALTFYGSGRKNPDPQDAILAFDIAIDVLSDSTPTLNGRRPDEEV
jgi:hypothetical protein